MREAPVSPPPPFYNDPKVKHLNIVCPAFGPADGYGNSCEQIAMGLERIGLPVTIAGPSQPCGPLNSDIFEKSRKSPTFGQAVMYYLQPPGFQGGPPRQGIIWRPTYGFTMFEATDIPKSWIPGLSRVEELWVPSEWNAEVFGQHSPKPIHVIPLGVDSRAFFARPRKRVDKLRFLHSSTYASENRKGADLAIEAFLKAFPGRSDVELVVRSTFPHDLAKRDARVSFMTKHLSTAELSSLYAQFDALLYPSRGEGFGLIPLEAMATGMPAIFPASSGMLSFANYGLTVGTRLVPAMIGSGRAGSQAWDDLQAQWFEPNLDELVDRLREVDTDYDRVQKKAMSDAALIARDWSWDRTAHAIRARLEA